MSHLKPGMAAPDFDLPDQSATRVRLSDFRGRSAVVLYFYPKDDTTGCTLEACRFRDEYEKFREAGAEILGVSADSGRSHEDFISKYKLPFQLLSDSDGSLRKLYGVTKTFGLIPGRKTFVIDANGIVRKIFDNQFKAERHAEQALAALRTPGR